MRCVLGNCPCFATLYPFFGLQPIGYHVANSLIFVVMAEFLYLALRGLNVGVCSRCRPRSCSCSCLTTPPIAFGSTVAHTLSMALDFGSLYALLRALKARDGAPCWSWLGASLGALAASGLCYEVPLPFFVLNAGLAWRRDRGGAKGPGGSFDRPSPRNHRGRLDDHVDRCHCRVQVADDSSPGEREERSTLTILRKTWQLNVPPESHGLNIEQALRTGFGDYGVGLPRLVLQVLRDGPPPQRSSPRSSRP